MTILSGTGSFPFCKISSLLSALEFFALNRILFLWLDFMSISRFLNFYLRGSLFFLISWQKFSVFAFDSLSFGEHEGDAFAFDHGIPHIPMS